MLVWLWKREELAPATTGRNPAISDRAQLEAFLLGSCEEVAAQAIESRLFADDAFYHELQAVKASLIEREIAGHLPESQSRLLRRQAMRSPALRAEIEAARRHASIASTPSAAKSLFASSRLTPLYIAAAVLLLAIAGVLLYPNWRSASHSPASAQITSPPPAISKAPARPLAFFLPALHLRGDQAIPTLALPKSPALIEVQIEVHGVPPRSINLRRGSSVIASQENPPVHTEGPIHYLSLLVDSTKLIPGDYRLDLAPSNPSAPHEQRLFSIRSNP